MAYGHSSGLPPLEASVIIAKKRNLFFSFFRVPHSCQVGVLPFSLAPMGCVGHTCVTSADCAYEAVHRKMSWSTFVLERTESCGTSISELELSCCDSERNVLSTIQRVVAIRV